MNVVRRNRWLKDGRSPRELLGAVLCLDGISSGEATDAGSAERRAGLHQLQHGPVARSDAISALTVTDVVEQLALQESDAAPQWTASEY